MLADVRRKGATVGSLDGWGWRELKALPVAWIDGLASILSKVEEIGVWPDGLPDAYAAMIPKTDGDATPGQRPLSVLAVVYRILASARTVQLEDWFRSWVPDSVFGAGGGIGSVEAWYTTALDIEEVLSALTLSIEVFWIGSCVVSAYLAGSVILILSIILRLGLGLSLLLGWGSPGLGMEAFLRVVP